MKLDVERLLNWFMGVLLTLCAECSLVESVTHVVIRSRALKKISAVPGQSHAAMRSHVLS